MIALSYSASGADVPSGIESLLLMQSVRTDVTPGILADPVEVAGIPVLLEVDAEKLWANWVRDGVRFELVAFFAEEPELDREALRDQGVKVIESMIIR